MDGCSHVVMIDEGGDEGGDVGLLRIDFMLFAVLVKVPQYF